MVDKYFVFHCHPRNHRNESFCDLLKINSKSFLYIYKLVLGLDVNRILRKIGRKNNNNHLLLIQIIIF